MVSDIVGCGIWVSQSLHLSTSGQGQGPSGLRGGLLAVSGLVPQLWERVFLAFVVCFLVSEAV